MLGLERLLDNRHGAIRLWSLEVLRVDCGRELKDKEDLEERMKGRVMGCGLRSWLEIYDIKYYLMKIIF